jgi:hypothetical protein
MTWGVTNNQAPIKNAQIRTTQLGPLVVEKVCSVRIWQVQN